MTRIRLLVVDDHALFRAGLVNLLGDMPEFQLVGEAGNGREALTIVETSEPDVVLLDVNMPVMNGVETVKAIRQLKKQSRILMLTISKHEDDLFGAITAGADGYLLKNAEPSELRKAILQVYEGKSVLSPEVTRPLLKAVAGNQGMVLDGGLSKRELEVLELLAQGKTTTQISGELYVSENTVKTHVRHILGKLEASNRAEAVSKAAQMGLIKLGW
ncbi:MAG: DNA-binding response regulator [Chloroflexota bacterium]|nr:MAG: DNA-binding response regulator [Chloroflexota bacterium]